MNYSVIEKNNKKYIQYASSDSILRTESDALNIIGACYEKDIWLLIIHEEALSEDFYNLRTGLAGAVLQKFMNYQIKAAVIIKNKEKISGRFREMALEANKGNDFRVYDNLVDAEAWLLQ